MRLHLDTNNAAEPAQTTNASPGVSATGKQETSDTGNVVNSGSSKRDQVAFSSASSAWSASFSDRAERVSQLATAVQNGTYRVASAAIGQSILANATA